MAQCEHDTGSGECDFCDVGFVFIDRNPLIALTYDAMLNELDAVSNRDRTNVSPVLSRRRAADDLAWVALVSEWLKHAEPGSVMVSDVGLISNHIFCVRLTEWPNRVDCEYATMDVSDVALTPVPPVAEPKVDKPAAPVVAPSPTMASPTDFIPGLIR